MSVCFLCISRARVSRRRILELVHGKANSVTQPAEKLSRERPLSNIFNLYVLLSVLLQFAIHNASMVYNTNLSKKGE